MNAPRRDHILVILLFASVIAVIATAHSGLRRSMEIAAAHQIAAIKERLDVYREAQGSYPERLEDIPDFSRRSLLDPWGIQLYYKRPDENGEFVLRSVGYDKSLTRSRARSTLHVLATGCSAAFVLLILGLRCRKDGRWPTNQSLLLLSSFAVGLYSRLADKGMLPLGRSPVSFYALLAVAATLAVLALVLTATKRDLLYLAALAIALYAVVSVLLLVA